MGTYVYACSLRNLKEVYVGGKLAAEGTRLMTFDESRVHSEVYSRLARMEKQAAAEGAESYTVDDAWSRFDECGLPLAMDQ
jgi:hypothetical protein